MALAEFNLRQLLEAGVHFGHQTKRWNPLMEQFIYGSRNGIHILDLTQTVPLLDAALNFITKTVSKGGIILFVGTKRQAQKPIAEAAEKSAQYFMNHRWLGGTLTNWKTVSNSIARLKKIDEQLSGNTDGLTKKERLNIEREQAKLQASLGGIREMGGVPDVVFVIDTNKEALAIQEANKLGIPVVAILDTNSDPQGISYPIPGNDDAARSIALYCDLVARAALDGMESQLGSSGVDLGSMTEPPLKESELSESIETQESTGKTENLVDEINEKELVNSENKFSEHAKSGAVTQKPEKPSNKTELEEHMSKENEHSEVAKIAKDQSENDLKEENIEVAADTPEDSQEDMQDETKRDK